MVMSANEPYNLSSVCSGSDMNDSIEDLDPAHTLQCFGDVEENSPENHINMEEDTETANHGGAKKTKARKENRKCTVCGDRALGYNFDAITCESCKAFFRRNANKSKHPRCMFQNSCTIDPNTRRFCSACRLAKCFAVGMKKEMILGDDERQKRIEKVQQNRAKKLVQLQKQTGVDIMGDLSPAYPHKDSPNSMEKLCSVKTEAKGEMSPGYSTEQALWSLINNPQSGVTISDPPAETPDSMYRLLGKRDVDLIQLIDTAYSSSFGSTAEETPLQLEMTSLETLMNHIGLLVKLLIRFAKKITDFTALPQQAQVTLLKGSLLDCITWRSAQIYDLEKGIWVNDEGTEIPIQLLNAAFDGVDSTIKHEHVKLISSMKRLIGNDLTLIAIVQCINLLSPEYAAVGNRAVTAAAQDRYVTLLKHYLEANHSWKDAFEMYSQLFNCMAACKAYTAKHSKAFSRADTSQVEPLLLEVFDISALK